MSERRPPAEQLIESARLASIGELAIGAAHEINNPLFAILGLLEFLLRDAEPGTKAHERLVLIQESGLQIKETVRTVLAFARDRSEARDVVSLAGLAAETVELLRWTSSAKGIELVEQYPGEELLVEAVPARIKHALLELLLNAQQAVGVDGTVTVEVAREGDRATLTVSDTGPGIPADVLPRVFEPFFTTDPRRGGIGLTVGRAIAERDGGELVARSQAGRGAELALSLPLARP